MWIIQKARGGFVGPFSNKYRAETYLMCMMPNEAANVHYVEHPYA
jgi:hypothetical protein